MLLITYIYTNMNYNIVENLQFNLIIFPICLNNLYKF
jgi:hypothetical protein